MIQTLFGSLEEQNKPGFLDRMKEAVTRTRENLAERIEEAVSFSKEIDRNTLDDLEATLSAPTLAPRPRTRCSKNSAKKPTANKSRMSKS